MVLLDNITIKAGNFRIQGLSMEIKRGMFNVLLGPTGSGKTVLLETIAGLIPPSSGKLGINGQDATRLAPENRHLSYLPQDHALFPHKNVSENISYGLELRGHSPALIRKRVAEIADAVHITPLLERNIQNLSGGEQQRVALARALVLDNLLLLLDEPTSALHETMQEDFCMLLKEIQRKYQLTVLMTTHHKDSAFLLADTMHFIEAGKLLLTSPARDVFRIPLPLKVAELLGVKNFLTLKKTAGPGDPPVYRCEALNASFSFSPEFTGGQPELCLGVKPEEIRVAREAAAHDPQENAFDVLVESVMLKENDALVTLRSPQSGFLLKMQLPIYNCRKLNIAEKNMIRCKIREDHARVIF